MKTGSSVLAAKTSKEMLEALRDESAGERYLLMAPLSDPEAFRACAGRKVLPAKVRGRLVALARGGAGDVDALLKRDDLSGEDLEKLSRAPGIGPGQAERIVRHHNCSIGAVAELAFLDARREQIRVKAEEKAPERSGHILGVLRTTNTLTRLASILVDNDLVANSQEVKHALRVLVEEKEASIEVFTTLAKDWYGTLQELLDASRELA